MAAFAGHAGQAGQCPSMSLNAESWLSGTDGTQGLVIDPVSRMSCSQGDKWFASGFLLTNQTINRPPTS